MGLMPEAAALSDCPSKMPWIRPSFSLAVLLLVQITSTSAYTEVSPAQVAVREGGTVKLTCTLTGLATKTNSSGLYFRENESDILDSFVTIINASTAQLTVHNISKSHIESDQKHKIYFCHHRSILENDSRAGSASVFVHANPVPLGEPKCISHNYNSLNCEWCSPQKPDGWNWTLKWSSVNGHVGGHISCSFLHDRTKKCMGHVQCKICGGHDSCICESNDEKDCFHRGFKYFLSIRAVDDQKVLLSQNVTRDPSKLVKPDPVRNLVGMPSSSNGSRHINLMWENPKYLSHRILQLEYHVTYKSKWKEKRTVFKCEKERLQCNGSVSVKNPRKRHGDYIMAATLSDLTPYTEYTVSVQAKPVHGGYLSDVSTVLAKTNEDVPSAGPVIYQDSYHLHKCERHLQYQHHQCRNVTFFWKMPNEQYHNGKITTCTVTIYTATSKQPLISKNTDSCIEEPWVQVTLEKEAAVAEVIMYTAVGPSPGAQWNISSLTDDLYPRNISVETTEDGGLDIEWGQPKSFVTGFTLYYGTKSAGNSIRDLQALSLPGNQTSLRLYNHSLPMPYQSYRFAMSAESGGRSSGLTDWLCVYAHDQDPRPPDLQQSHDRDLHSIGLYWDTQWCMYNLNYGRPEKLNISWVKMDQNLPIQGKTLNVTLPASQSSFEIHDLDPSTKYAITMETITKEGRSSRVTREYMTGHPMPVAMITGICVASFIGLVLIVLLPWCRRCFRFRRFKTWLEKDVQPEYPMEAQDFIMVSKESCDSGMEEGERSEQYSQCQYGPLDYAGLPEANISASNTKKDQTWRKSNAGPP